MSSIGRVKGPLLQSDLDRQGVDLQFTTDDHPLLYLDFANFKLGVNTNTISKSETFTVVGNALIDGVKINGSTLSAATDLIFSPVGNVELGDVAKVKIGGGQLNYILTTDGNSNTSWKDINSVGSSLSLNGMSIVLGTPTDGSVIDNASYRYWTETTTVTDAVDALNQVMLNVYKNTYVGQVDFTANVVSGNSPLTVQFNSSIVGNPTSFLWEFGDGTTSALRNPVHTYSSAAGGQFSVYFKAFNTQGTLSGSGANGSGAQGSYHDITKPNYISLYTPVPVPLFSVNDTSIDSGSSVSLTNLSLNGVSYIVHWGDGTSDQVLSNSDAGGPTGGPISHQYTVTSDTSYNITLTAHNPTAGASSYVTSAPTTILVFANQTPSFTATPTSGNNQHASVPNGLVVTFSNTSLPTIGQTTIFPANKIVWDWGDGTFTNVTVNNSSPGNVGNDISHAFTLTHPTISQVFTVTMTVETGHSLSPFYAVTKQITVIPAPTAIYSARAAILSDRVGDTQQTGYNFIDLSGANRGNITFTNSSLNTNSYQWTYGDGVTGPTLAEGDVGSVMGGPITHLYQSPGSFSVSLLATGDTSLTLTDDTLTKQNYVSILPPPPPPPSLSSKLLSVQSIGNNPLVAYSITNNSLLPEPLPGTPVSRVPVTLPTISTTVIADAYNSYAGSLIAEINGTSEPAVTLTSGDDVGIYGSLHVTVDRDAHAYDPLVYPTNFFKVFSGKIEKAAIDLQVGYNTFKITHTAEGTTNVAGFIRDNVTTIPTLDVSNCLLTTQTPGNIVYISGIPYFSTGGVLELSGVKAFNWIGQTYTASTSPLTISTSSTIAGTGQIVLPQVKTYADLNNSSSPYLNTGVPIANTGSTITTPYTIAPVTINVNPLVSATGKVQVTLKNVNGESNPVEIQTPINVYAAAPYGFDEFNIPVSPTLGLGYTTNGKRIDIGSQGASPTFSSTIDYYVDQLLSGPLPAGSDDAVVKFGVLEHDTTDYSVYLPQGPNLSNNVGPQFLRFAFKRTIVANFTVAYTGRISGLKITAPGTQIDATSSDNGWIDATQVYAGAGIPGENTAAGGNGSNGCAKTAGDVLPVGQQVTAKTVKLTLGSENSSNSYANQILVSVMLSPGDTLTSISIS